MQGQGHFADLVQKERAAVRGFDATSAGGDGTGEGAAGVAEELRFKEVLWNGGAIEDGEGLAGAFAEAVYGLGDEFLAGAGFPLDEDRCGAWSDEADDACEVAHARRVADEFRQGEDGFSGRGVQKLREFRDGGRDGLQAFHAAQLAGLRFRRRGAGDKRGDAVGESGPGPGTVVGIAVLHLAQGVQQLVAARGFDGAGGDGAIQVQQIHGRVQQTQGARKLGGFKVGQPAVEQDRRGRVSVKQEHGFRAAIGLKHRPAHGGELPPQTLAQEVIRGHQQNGAGAEGHGDAACCHVYRWCCDRSCHSCALPPLSAHLSAKWSRFAV